MIALQGDDAPLGFGGTNDEITVLKHLIELQAALFKVDTLQRKKQDDEARARAKLDSLINHPAPVSHPPACHTGGWSVKHSPKLSHLFP